MEKKLDYKTIDSLETFFSKVDLYVPISFNLYTISDDPTAVLNKEELKRLLGVIDIEKNSIDCYCVFCNKEYSFDVAFGCSESEFIKMYNDYHYVMPIGDGAYIDLSKPRGTSLPETISISMLSNMELVYLNYEFTCNKHSNHKYRMYLIAFVEKGNVLIKKIGQFPSKIDIWGFDFDKYKTQLNKFNAYQDFKKAELCMSDKLFAGAFTYLRRVFEKMLNSYCEDKSLLFEKTEIKIESCKDKFDPRVKPLLKNLYSILSSGIHQLSDEQSEEYYIDLRTVIELQLEYIKELNDREEQTKTLKDRIDKISNEIK